MKLSSRKEQALFKAQTVVLISHDINNHKYSQSYCVFLENQLLNNSFQLGLIDYFLFTKILIIINEWISQIFLPVLQSICQILIHTLQKHYPQNPMTFLSFEYNFLLLFIPTSDSLKVLLHCASKLKNYNFQIPFQHSFSQ